MVPVGCCGGDADRGEDDAVRPDCDPLFPPGVGRPPGGEWFSDVTVPVLGGVGHFAPVEAPAAFAAAILDATRR